MTTPSADAPGMTPTQRAARILNAACEARDALSPREAAEAAVRAGGPSVDEIEAKIIASRRSWPQERVASQVSESLRPAAGGNLVIAGSTLRMERGRLGMTQLELAGAIGVSRRAVVDWENNNRPVPLTRNARILDIFAKAGGPSGPAIRQAQPDQPRERPRNWLSAASDLDLIGELMRRLSRNDGRS